MFNVDEIDNRFSELDLNSDCFISPLEFDRDLTADAIRAVEEKKLT